MPSGIYNRTRVRRQPNTDNLEAVVDFGEAVNHEEDLLAHMNMTQLVAELKTTQIKASAITKLINKRLS